LSDTRKRSHKGAIIALAGLAVFVALIYFFVVNPMWQNQVWGYEFDKFIQGKFDTADRSSDAITKSKYYDQMIGAMISEHLNEGKASIFQNDKPQADLPTQFDVAKSLQNRLHSLARMNPDSMQYQQGMSQISLQEFCWFPMDVFEQGYMLKHGVWGNAFFAPEVKNRCDTHKQNPSSN
jgi:hypothetical protein